MSAPPDSRPRTPQDKRMSLDNILNPSHPAPPFTPCKSSPPSSPTLAASCERPRPESLTPDRYKGLFDPYRDTRPSSRMGQRLSTTTESSPLSPHQSMPSTPECHFSHPRGSSAVSDAGSDVSSALSEPPPDFDRLSPSPLHRLSPPSSQPESPSTPRSIDESVCTSSTENDGPPSKRRRIERGPRETQRLNLFATDPSKAQQAHLEKLVKGFKKYKKVVVIAGAGISVSAGIPDFRSKDGLFKSLKSEHKLRGSGKDLFDASVYSDEGATETFHKMVRNMSEMVKDVKPTAFHDFCARLAHEGRLLRMYTQNIDGLEIALQPLKYDAHSLPLPKKGPWPKVLQLHGGLAKATCTKCGALSELDGSKFDGPVPPACGACEDLDAARTVIAGKRSHGVGRLRPRMVLYHEHNPDDEAIGACTSADLRARPDCVVVAGTSMKIPGVRRIVREMCKIVRDRKDGMTVWINHDSEPAGKEFEGLWDFIVEGGSDQVAHYAGLGKWDDPIETIRPNTEEEDRIAAQSSQASVVLDGSSPTFIESGGLPTPRDSPRLLERAVDAFDAIQPQKQSILTATRAAPAGKVAKGKGVNATKKTTGGRAKAGAGGAKSTKGTKAPNPTTKSIKKMYTTSKPGADATSKGEKAQPSTPTKRKQPGLSEARVPSPKQNVSVAFPGLSRKAQPQDQGTVV